MREPRPFGWTMDRSRSMQVNSMLYHVSKYHVVRSACELEQGVQAEEAEKVFSSMTKT